MSLNTEPADWSFLTNHAQVLICLAREPEIRLRDLGDQLGITERAAHRIVRALADGGYINRRRNGRRNHYTINAHLPLPDALAREQNIGELLKILNVGTPPRDRLTGPPPSPRPHAPGNDVTNIRSSA